MSDSPEEQIKPCPCCGHKAEHEELDEPKSSPNWGGEIIACSHCGLATAVVFSCKEPAITELLRLWNSRSAEAAARKELRKAEEMAADWADSAGWATGHGDTLVDILAEMRSQHCDERSYTDLHTDGGLPEAQRAAEGEEGGRDG